MGFISPLVEKELGERNFGFDSEFQIEPNIEEKAMLQQIAVSSLQVHIISQTLHCFDLSVVCRLLRRQSSRTSLHCIWTRRNTVLARYFWTMAKASFIEEYVAQKLAVLLGRPYIVALCSLSAFLSFLGFISRLHCRAAMRSRCLRSCHGYRLPAKTRPP